MSEITKRLSSAIADRYKIESRLGQGGMATVYLAHDLKHDRKVALKVLRPELAAVLGAERFVQEIKTTASLQHPNILPLFDSGTAGGRDGGTEFLYYVMPYIEGETLRDKLDRETQFGVEEAVKFTTDVADALDYAHRAGVIHRDIKPENILLHDGRPMVADFGIALAVSAAAGGRMTETGLSLGTPHYMSPEQATAEKDLTNRSDIYSLGSVLYEMLTGSPPHVGSSAQQIIMKIVTEEAAPVTNVRKAVPPNVAAAVAKSLEKLPADRFENANAFAEALGDPAFAATLATAGAGPRRSSFPPSRHPAILPVFAVTTVLALALAAWGWFRPSASAPVVRYALALPPSQAPDPGAVAIPSPDGSYVVYVGGGTDVTGGNQLWVKARNAYAATPLPGTLGVAFFTISPDGEWIAYNGGGSLWKVPVAGGPSITLVDGRVAQRPTIAWLEDGTIIFAASGLSELARVSDRGGTPTVVWSSDSLTVNQVTALPGGRGVLFQACPTPCATQDVWALDLRSETSHMVVPALYAQYVPTGHLVYVADGAMFAVPFDLGSLRTRGAAVPVLDSIAVIGTDVLVRVGASGTLVMRRGAAVASREFQLVWVDRAGEVTVIDTAEKFHLTNFAGNQGWALSPDGTRLAIGLGTASGDDIWLKALPAGPLSRVSYDAGADFRPRWMPDGVSIMYGSSRNVSGLYRRRADGTGTDSLLVEGAFDEGLPSPDGRWLLLRSGATSAAAGGRDIFVMQVGVDSVPRPLLATPYDEMAIALSPDGRLLAYQSDETGQVEVFIRPFPDVDSGKQQISDGGGTAPLWSRDGTELFYISAEYDMMAVAVSPTGGIEVGTPRRLFRLSSEGWLVGSQFYTPWDVGPDGRFIMARSLAGPSQLAAPLIVVENWFEELKGRVGR